MKYEFDANEISYTFENGIHILGIADAKDELKTPIRTSYLSGCGREWFKGI